MGERLASSEKFRHGSAGNLIKGYGMNDEKMCPVPSDSVPPGIVKTTVETDGQSMVIDYDPRAISDESVRQVAARLVPETQRRFDKCVMRLGGRACEACALKLERKAQRIQGVARAQFLPFVITGSVIWHGR